MFRIGLLLIPGLLLVRENRTFALMSLALALPPILIVLNPFVFPRIYTGDLGPANAILQGIPVSIIIVLAVGTLIVLTDVDARIDHVNTRWVAVIHIRTDRR